MIDMLKRLTDMQIKELFGDFKYRDRKNGRVIIEKEWVRENIVLLKRPLLKKIRCHHLIKDQLLKIFQEIDDKGLSGLIDLIDTVKRGGCFFPRHINWDTGFPLSRHSWGIAIEVNPSTNRFGAGEGSMDLAIVEIFEKNGFIWGGRWQIPDPMHFEFARSILTV